MKLYRTNKKTIEESGYMLVGVLIVSAICLLITLGMLESATSTSSTRFVVNRNTENFYDVERTINRVTAWLQNNSKNIVNAFNAANFTNNFDLTSPIVGNNQGSTFSIPTMIKMKGTSHDVQLTNSSYFGSSAFPSTTNIDTGAAFNAATVFQSTDFGDGVNVRLLAVWALQTDGNYQPIFRVDAVTGGAMPEHGVHGINFVKSALVTSSGGIGYYADLGDFQTSTPNNECWSYQYSYNAGTNTWSKGAARSNCLITGKDDITLKSAIHGNVYTLKSGGLHLDGGAVSGSTCQGGTCPVTYTLPVNPTWAARCGGVPIVNKTATANPENLATGDVLATQCFQDVTIPSNKAFRFITPDKPYYIKNLLPQNNSNSRILFDTVGPGHKYTIYVNNLANGSINGNQLVATNLAPNQLEIYITQDGTLTLNGTAAMNGVITGTLNHTIKHLGNFVFTGALRSNAIQVIGNAVLGYDEALGGAPALSDINFTLYKASQRYR